MYFLVGEADPGFRETGRVAAATLLAALALASGLLNAAAMTSCRVAAPLRGLLSCPCR